MTGILDPYAPGKYYHSVVGDLGMTAADWRSAGTPASAPAPVTTRYVGPSYLDLRTGASTAYRIVTVLGPGIRLAVYESTSTDWLYVRIPDGRYGWVAGRYTR
jgi:uncharacterized protein YraI